MEKNLESLLAKTHELEQTIVRTMRRGPENLRHLVVVGTKEWPADLLETQEVIRRTAIELLVGAPIGFYFVAPLIYAMIIPAVIMDAFVSVFQFICFPIYGISRVHRRDYFAFDRARLDYLNWIERINCNYCAYFNGLISYVQEIASRTEQYFCPIRHASELKGLHARQAAFIPYGDADHFREKFAQLRREITEYSGENRKDK